MTADHRVLGIVLAGGRGKRLMPLTAVRAKPAVPFGGAYRLIDFVLSNLVNGDIHRIAVLTQYKSHSLDRHISLTWRLSSVLGHYVTAVPAQQRRGPTWYQGSADAIYQSFNLLHDESPKYVVVFGADHVYRMDPRQMLEHHIASGAGVTVAGIRVPREQATAFGVIDTKDGSTISGFLEKPSEPPGLPDNPDQTFASMGNYIFTTEALVSALTEDAESTESKHDMGGDVIPRLVDKGEAHVYDFDTHVVPGETERDHGYWRDVGTIDTYLDAHLDLISVQPIFNLYNPEWPVLGPNTQRPPAKFVAGGVATNSMVCEGSIVSAQVTDSVLAPDVMVEEGAVVQASVLLDGVRVGRGAVVRRAILDKNVHVPDGAHIGVDLDHDRQHYHVSPCDVVVLGKGQRVV